MSQDLAMSAFPYSPWNIRRGRARQYEKKGVNDMTRISFRSICAVLALGAPLGAHATPHTLTTTLTADNHYAIYFGDESGSKMRNATMNGVHARNEMGPAGAPGTYNWSIAETWTLDYQPDDYLYIVTWSDDRVAQGWLGQFQSATESFLTGLNQGWEYLLGNTNLGDNDPAPTATDLASLVQPANWTSVTNFRDHGVSPWGFIAGVSASADWIWGTPTMNEHGTGEGEYQVFRRRLATVPEPGTLLLAATAIGGMVCLRRRQGA